MSPPFTPPPPGARCRYSLIAGRGSVFDWAGEAHVYVGLVVCAWLGLSLGSGLRELCDSGAIHRLLSVLLVVSAASSACDGRWGEREEELKGHDGDTPACLPPFSPAPVLGLFEQGVVVTALLALLGAAVAASLRAAASGIGSLEKGAAAAAPLSSPGGGAGGGGGGTR